MTQLLNVMNDTMEIVSASRNIKKGEQIVSSSSDTNLPFSIDFLNNTGIDVELGRFFSTNGYKVGRLFAVTEENTLYRVTSFIIDGKWYGEISIKKDFEFNHIVFDDQSIFDSTAKIIDGSVELNKVHRDIFIKALQVEDYCEHKKFSSIKELDENLIFDICVPIYSPILSF